MTSQAQMATALLTEHFRYTPLTLLDDIINTVNELVFRAINAVEEGLSDASAASLGFSLSSLSSTTDTSNLSAREKQALLDETKDAEIASGVIQLETLLNATVDKDFDKFEIYVLRNILAVGREEEDLARWVRLEHYRGIDLGASAAGAAATPESVQLARRKLHETKKLNAMLKAEEARNAAVLAQVRGLVGGSSTVSGNGVNTEGRLAKEAPLAFLQRTQEQSRQHDRPQELARTLQLALEHLPALRTNLEGLKSTLRTLPQQQQQSRQQQRTKASDADEDNSEDAKRRRYLESRTRKALERKGLDVDDGLGAASGQGLLATRRRVGKEEAEGLEGIVGALRRERDDDVDMED